MPGRLSCVLVCCLLLLLPGCSLGDREPPPGQGELVVDGRQILVEPGLTRDFMPGATPPDGDPMVIYVKLWAPDSQPLPPELGANRAWVVNGRAVWETGLKPDSGSWRPPYLTGAYACGGPKWGPDIPVDVTVRVFLPGGETVHVLVPDCVIGRVE